MRQATVIRPHQPAPAELNDPIGGIGRAICAKVAPSCGIVRIDFSLRNVMPPGVFSVSPPSKSPSRQGQSQEVLQ